MFGIVPRERLLKMRDRADSVRVHGPEWLHSPVKVQDQSGESEPGYERRGNLTPKPIFAGDARL